MVNVVYYILGRLVHKVGRVLRVDDAVDEGCDESPGCVCWHRKPSLYNCDCRTTEAKLTWSRLSNSQSVLNTPFNWLATNIPSRTCRRCKLESVSHRSNYTCCESTAVSTTKSLKSTRSTVRTQDWQSREEIPGPHNVDEGVLEITQESKCT